jgi:transposase-like protein
MNGINTLQKAIQYFSDENVCIDAVANLRWPNGVPVCPRCFHKEHYWLASQKRWKCKKCMKQFSVKVGTIFEDSPIPLSKWLLAMWMIANCRNGISSYEIHRAIGVSQKSAWFMLHRIRMLMHQPSWKVGKVGGGNSEVEADESYIGGKLGNMHSSKKAKLGMAEYGGHWRSKTIVMGVLDRAKGQVRAEVIPFADRDKMHALVHKNVKIGSTLYTDNHQGYDGLRFHYDHEVINHMEQYVRGRVHTNGIENFWSLLKRGLHGTYIAVEPYHLHRYVDEQTWRYNNRKRDDEVPPFAVPLSMLVLG